jgi:arginine exporter protein ArgO
MMSTKYGIPGVVAFFTGHILADLAWYSAVSFSFARGARLINDSVYKGIIAVCGTALVAFAVWFGWTGVAALTRA